MVTAVTGKRIRLPVLSVVSVLLQTKEELAGQLVILIGGKC